MTFPVRLLLFALTLTSSLSAAASVETDGLGPNTAALLNQAYDDSSRLFFDKSEVEARKAMALQPENIVPLLYLQNNLAAWIVELGLAHRPENEVSARFAVVSAQALVMEAAWEDLHHDGLAQLYLGTSLGEQALVALAHGKFVASYKDGLKADTALLLARQRDPDLLDTDLGLGEYLYFCGRINGLLRLILDLHGDIPGGIALMRTCAAGSVRCSVPARMQLALIFTEQTKDYETALPFVQEAQTRYPENWAYEKAALEEARGLGLRRAEAKGLIEAVSSQWDAGWRPPKYEAVDPAPLRLALAKAYLKDAKNDDALRHLRALVETGNAKEKTAAGKLLESLSRTAASR